MRTINICLASSITEFKQERDELGNFFRRLDLKLEGWDIRLKAHLCEDLSNNFASDCAPKQGEFDEFILQSQFIFFLIGKDVGEHTLHEFHLALEKFRKTGNPEIHVYFINTSDKTKPCQSVENFKNDVQKLKQYYKSVSSIEEVKVDISSVLHEQALNIEKIDKPLSFGMGFILGLGFFGLASILSLGVSYVLIRYMGDSGVGAFIMVVFISIILGGFCKSKAYTNKRYEQKNYSMGARIGLIFFPFMAPSFSSVFHIEFWTSEYTWFAWFAWFVGILISIGFWFCPKKREKTDE